MDDFLNFRVVGNRGIAAKDGSHDWSMVRGEQFSVGNVEKGFSRSRNC